MARLQGAPEAILERCSTLRLHDGKVVAMTEAVRRSILDINTQWGAGEVRGVAISIGGWQYNTHACFFFLPCMLGLQQTLRVLAIAVVDQARDKKEYRFDKPENFASYEVRLAPQQSNACRLPVLTVDPPLSSYRKHDRRAI